MFLVFAIVMWVRQEVAEERVDLKSREKKENFLNTAYSSFVVIFLAEWGDLTQLSTAALAAKYNSPVTLFAAATLALWAVTSLVILIGHRAKTLIHPRFLKQIASIAFAIVGIVLLVEPYK